MVALTFSLCILGCMRVLCQHPVVVFLLLSRAAFLLLFSFGLFLSHALELAEPVDLDEHQATV